MNINWTTWKKDILTISSALISVGAWAAQANNAQILQSLLPPKEANFVLSTISFLAAAAALISARITPTNPNTSTTTTSTTVTTTGAVVSPTPLTPPGPPIPPPSVISRTGPLPPNSKN